MDDPRDIVRDFREIAPDYAPNPDAIMNEEDDRVRRLKQVIADRLDPWERNIIILYADCGSLRELGKRKWIPREKSLSQFKGRAMGAGSVRRDCDIWEEYCTARRIPFEAVAPRPGATKWDADYFARVTGWTGRTSNHARDAALLVFGKSASAK